MDLMFLRKFSSSVDIYGHFAGEYSLDARQGMTFLDLNIIRRDEKM